LLEPSYFPKTIGATTTRRTKAIMTKDHIRNMITHLEKMLVNAPDVENPTRVVDHPPDPQCSFCGKLRSEVGPVVEGPGQIYMCCNCVELSLPIIQNEWRKQITSLQAKIKQMELERDGSQ
jgi:hypothetical protein